MKNKLNWQSDEVVNVFDEASLWSAPFVQLLLEQLPMVQGAQVLDIGFGTGVPLIELAQRFGSMSNIYGVDLWKAAISRTKEKMRVFELENITIFEQSAEAIPLPNESIDLICSNLGINNFDNKEDVLKECYRVLKSDGHLCITTNIIGTFSELLLLFERAMQEMKLTDGLLQLGTYISHRESVDSIVSKFSSLGFSQTKIVQRETHMRFMAGNALFNHGLMRIGFLEGWEKLIPIQRHLSFFSRVAAMIDEIVLEEGCFKISIPIVYLEFSPA